ncbi:unnamed protein product [Ilex paraguariensis]|uniref:Phytocyanin domain-containing protein n=1 Tax=Ilex paraguariensis TaxID=185542 RepID=A0ABC8UX52_9AQUA
MGKFMSMFVVCVFAAAMLHCAAAQTVYVVGDSLGWTIPSNGAAAYTTWASGKTFMVGDTLTFNFLTNQHDVLQVPKASYDACISDNASGNPIMTGPANVSLNAAGDHYYICTFGDHCQNGQKLAITVSGTPLASPPTTTTTPPPPATPSPTSNTPSACPPTDGPTTSTTPGGGAAPPPPNSSSSAVLSNFFLVFMAFAMALCI